MRLKEVEGEQALELLAEMLDPCKAIFSDEEVAKKIKSGAPKIEWAKTMLRRTPKAIIELLAIIDGEDPKTYKVNALTLPFKLLEILNDPDIANLFSSQSQRTVNASSGSVRENTEA